MLCDVECVWVNVDCEGGLMRFEGESDGDCATAGADVDDGG